MRPQAKRIGELFYEDELQKWWVQEGRDLRLAAASRLGLEHVQIIIARSAEFPAIERAIRAARIDLMTCVSEGEEPWKQDLIRFLVRSRIPFDSHVDRVMNGGGLIGTYPSWSEAYRDAFSIVAQILRGANPASIPVRTPTRFHTAINLRTARAMGLTIPSSILLRADEVLE